MAKPDHTSLSQNYETPDEIYIPVMSFAGIDKFSIDVACSRKNIPASFHCTKEGVFSIFEDKWSDEDGLSFEWFGTCWMNCRWDKTSLWLFKAFNEFKKNDCEIWCCLPGNRLNTGYSDRHVGFQKLLNENNNWFIVALAGKFNFNNPDLTLEQNEKNRKNGGLNTPVFILYIGKRADEYAERWKKEQPIKGIVLKGA